jgi:hypothetical protein
MTRLVSPERVIWIVSTEEDLQAMLTLWYPDLVTKKRSKLAGNFRQLLRWVAVGSDRKDAKELDNWQRLDCISWVTSSSSSEEAIPVVGKTAHRFKMLVDFHGFHLSSDQGKHLWGKRGYAGAWLKLKTPPAWAVELPHLSSLVGGTTALPPPPPSTASTPEVHLATLLVKFIEMPCAASSASVLCLLFPICFICLICLKLIYLI